MTASEITALARRVRRFARTEVSDLAALFVLAGWSLGAAWAMALRLVAQPVQRRQPVRVRGPHAALLPDDPVTAKDPPVIGE